MIIKVCGLSDVGKRRELNEDSFGVYGFEDGALSGVCVLADGMGGHNAGEVASSMAVEAVMNELKEDLSQQDSNQISHNIMAAIDYANSNIYEKSLKNPEQAGMGTTLVVAYVTDSFVRVANIGDSRAYVVSQNKICRITVDHSVVEELVQRGSITREEARRHPDKNIITRALGTDLFVEADYYDYVPTVGETILLCSDGLTEMVDEDEIKDIINNAENENLAVQSLVEKANENGGVDNITVVALRFAEEAKADDADR